jgi:hypothetical protein
MTNREVLKLLAVALTLAALTGCGGDAKRDLASCRLKAIEEYHLRAASKDDDEDAAYYVEICMQAAGYQLQVWTKGCSDTASRLKLETCYQRETWWDW